jgi:hypothetical protein
MDDVDVVHRAGRGVVETGTERGAGLVDAGSVDQHDLGIPAVEDTADL